MALHVFKNFSATGWHAWKAGKQPVILRAGKFTPSSRVSEMGCSIADLFQHLFHLARDGGPKFSLGLSGEMQAIDTIC
jgi:hypothetical protein